MPLSASRVMAPRRRRSRSCWSGSRPSARRTSARWRQLRADPSDQRPGPTRPRRTRTTPYASRPSLPRSMPRPRSQDPQRRRSSVRGGRPCGSRTSSCCVTPSGSRRSSAPARAGSGRTSRGWDRRGHACAAARERRARRPEGTTARGAVRLCDARGVDPWFIVSVLLAVVAGSAAIILVRRWRAEERRRARVEASPRETAAVLLEASDERNVLLDILSSGVIQLDARLLVREANPAAHALLGWSAGSLTGRSTMEAFLDPAVESMARAALDGTAGVVEIRRGDPDGPALLVRRRRAAGGGVWLVLEDVSELRRLQRIRTEFIDNLSHELRTPLTTVSLLAETLARDADTSGDAVPAKMRDRIAKIEVETGHLVQMVNELLDLSRIESGGTMRLVGGLDMGRLAAESAERLRLFAERQGVTLRTEIEPVLPSVRGDGARLGQVVVNLVHNAVKFSPDGGDVVIRARAVGDEVVTSIEDHGVGIPRAAQDRVFERFYKVDRARLRAEAGGGTGLGLAISRHVVEQHGGRIWVESEEGRGSTFSFALPAGGGNGHH